MDIWFPPAEFPAPRPTLLFFHGGGLLVGGKYHSRILREMRALGVVTVAANYRLARSPGTTVADTMADGALALKFLLSQADNWNLDRKRIGLLGTSMGGCVALWLGLNRDDIRCVGTYNSPTSIDPELLLTEIGVSRLESYIPFSAALFSAYSVSACRTERVRRIIASYSPLEQTHKNGPPLFLDYSKDKAPIGEREKWLDAIHCPRYGELMKERYTEHGLRCELNHPAGPASVDRITFLKEMLEV